MNHYFFPVSYCQFRKLLQQSTIHFSANFDIVLRGLVMTPKRLKVVDFLHPIDGDREAIVIKNNLNESYNYAMFFEVLSLKG
jgi:hypothetical protein